MTVNDLVDKLKAIPGEWDVMISSDEEGNRFKAVVDVEESPVDSSGEPCHEEDADENSGHVIILWP